MFDLDKVNKEVSFRFYGENLKFLLSHGLFSSFDIDVGSRLLLKELAKEVDWEKIKKVYEVGCGVGTLGLSIKKKFPQTEVYLQDRDALAVSFTKENAAQNNLQVSAETGLSLLDAPDGDYDLILSNLPAKAGEPVLSHFIRNSGAYLSQEGIVAIVIVNTLADWAESEILKSGGSIQRKEQSKQHTVFIFNPPRLEKDDTDLSIYIRNEAEYTLNECSYKLSTVNNIPDFDNLSYEILLCGKILKKENLGGRILICNPGQGHLAKYLQNKKGSHIKEYNLAGRDCLSLQISQYNLKDQPVKIYTAPDYYNLLSQWNQEPCDFISLQVVPITKTKWAEEIWSVIPQLVKKNGKILFVGRSADIAGLLKVKKGVKTLTSLKEKGKRAILVETL